MMIRVAALLLVLGVFGWSPPTASAQSRGQCLASDSSVDLAPSGDGFDVTASVALGAPDGAVVGAELHKFIQGGSDEVVMTGTAVQGTGAILAFSGWVARDSLGNAGNTASVYALFNVPGQASKRTCAVLNLPL